MGTQARLITAEEFFREYAGQFCELIDGEVVMLTPAGGEHGNIALNVGHLLAGFVKPRRLGKVYGADTGFIIRRDPDTVRAPDAAFIHRDRERSRADSRSFLPGAPDLAVEVVSPGDSRREVHEKALEWLATGTMLVWVVWPDTRQVTVYRPDAEPLTLTEDRELDGGELLPGFRCRIAEFFE